MPPRPPRGTLAEETSPVKRLLWASAIALLLTSGVSGHDAAVWTGHLQASEHEAQEGYFAIGEDAMVVAKPGTVLHTWLTSRLGQPVRVTIEPDSSSK